MKRTMMQFIKAFFAILVLLAFDHCSDKPTNLNSELEDLGEIRIVGAEEENKVTTQIDSTVTEKPLMEPFDPDFLTGKWEAEDQNGISFDLWIYVEDGIASGQYCAINEDASRIDCGEEDEDCFFKGEILDVGDSLFLDIKSCYSLKEGKASLSIHGEGLKWTLIESPGKFGMDHFAPREAILGKTHFDPFE